jgi:type I restriction enzyme S subunit
VSAAAEAVSDLPDGWEWKKLVDVVEILDRLRVPVNAKERAERQGDVPYYGATGQVGYIDDHIYDEELVLLGEDGAPFFDPSKRKAYVIRGKSWVNNHAHVLKGKDGLQNAYIKYYLDHFDYHGYVTGTTRLKLNQGRMKEIPIPIAPTEQRESIVAEIEKQFSRLDEAAASLKRVKANLKRYKAAVLKAAVEGKLTEEWRKQNPDVEPARKLLERMLAERRAKWEDAELAKMKAKGKEPTNDKWKEKYKEPSKPIFQGDQPVLNKWAVVSLEAVSNALGGYAFKSKLFTESGPQVVKMANIKMGKLDLSARPSFIQEVPEEIVSKYRLVDGDILVTLTGTRKKRDYGYVVQVREPKNILLLNQRIARLRPYSKELSEYLAISLEGEGFRDRFFSHETGNVGQGNVGMKAVSEEYILLPPAAEQKEIVKEWQRMDSMVVELLTVCERQLLRADRLRQSILAGAFGGRGPITPALSMVAGSVTEHLVESV